MKGIKEKLRRAVQVAAPAAKALDKVAGVALQLKKPTLIGGIALASSGLSALGEALGSGEPVAAADRHVCLLVGRAAAAEALRDAGAVVVTGQGDDPAIEARFAGGLISLAENGHAYFYSQAPEAAMEWARQAIDRSAGAVLQVGRSGADCDRVSVSPGRLRGITSDRADAICQSVRPFLAEGVVALIHGRPGVGKTTIAHRVAELAGIGRVVVMDAAVCGGGHDEGPGSPLGQGGMADALALVSTKVLIVDDIDKIHMNLATLEAMRAPGRLVILTANNGESDHVLDGAFCRPGRIDEIFEVVAEAGERRPPFDELSPADWARVERWPAAWQATVAQRLRLRPHDLGLDELEQRLRRGTASYDGVVR